MPQIRPITDFRKPNEISNMAHAKKEPIFITKNGYVDLVVMSIETFNSLLEDCELDAVIAEAEAEYTSDDQLKDAREVLSILMKKHVEK